jgi:hypothetical protein
MLRARQFTTASRIVRSNYATSAAAAAHTSTKNIRSALISDFKSTDDQVTPSMRVRGPSRRLVAPQQLRREYPKQNGPAIFAMRARLGLAEMNLDLLKDICSKQSEKRDSYAEMGMRQLDNQIRQHLRHTYPNMPDLIIDRVRNALTESSVLHAVAGDFGVEHTIIESEMDAQYAQIVRAIIGAAVVGVYFFLHRAVNYDLGDKPGRTIN